MSVDWGTVDAPSDRVALCDALIDRRKRTLAIYADIPEAYWIPASVPYLPIVNPPLWEMAHIGWFAEFFGIRWRPEDPDGIGIQSIWKGADALLDSRIIPHRERWLRHYPERAQLFDYLAATLERLTDHVKTGPDGRVGLAQLALLHEDMHAEAFLMTLQTLGLSLPEGYSRASLDNLATDLSFGGGDLRLGDSKRNFRFDNEAPAKVVSVSAFSVSSQPVSGQEMKAFRHAPDYLAPENWGVDGLSWLEGRPDFRDQAEGFAAMHVSWYEARAFCRWSKRRLPTEAEWEFAALSSEEFRASCGHVWEWTSSPFEPFPGFLPGAYADYSRPWFGDHTVLKGGSFATEGRLRYPQYRNFFVPGRCDMFCGFRTCRIN